ncbi:MAG: dolichyl-diphosphooligosaccharide--protein glycosyltransferase subunit 1 [Piccolia ochrophora]|nr:MAG: dolichyl-diphosphooligosaccharide--protein glycosyltransferase subunit 1 [Piccolia ochrophora]
MRASAVAASLLSIFATASAGAADANLTKPLSSRILLPSTFKPPQVFKNVNLLRNINLEKGYSRETINVVIENIDKNAQDEYFLPFEAGIVDNVGGLEVRDKKEPDTGLFEVELVEYDTYSSTQFFRIRLPKPLKFSAQQTLSISYALLSAFRPLPATINQVDKQYLVHTFSAYSPSAYETLKQKTKLKLPTTDIPDHTPIPSSLNTEGHEDPQRQGSTFTYGPYRPVPAGTVHPVRVRYEFTKPLLHATLLERDVEVSHWGGNLATEERFWLRNNGAQLENHFSRVSWATTSYYNPPTSALRELKMPLRVGASNPYFIDDIGNVSTSRFRSSPREAHLELKPRYPVFGGWKYSFRVGWDADLKHFLRRAGGSEGYVLKVPFLEGPKQPEGIEYERVEVRVILPEGATNINYETTVPLIKAETSLHRTFMDTVGRTVLKLTAVNAVDEFRDRDLFVTYDQPFLASLRKPLTIFVGMLAVFAGAWGLGKVDTSIGKRGK